MGYELHITRTEDWCESENAPITLDEWDAYVESDVEMRRDDTAVANFVDGSTLEYESAGLSVWRAWSGHEDDGNMAWFDYREGRVVVKNPDEEIIHKMKSIAERFNARVVGDDGELY